MAAGASTGLGSRSAARRGAPQSEVGARSARNDAVAQVDEAGQQVGASIDGPHHAGDGADVGVGEGAEPFEQRLGVEHGVGVDAEERVGVRIGRNPVLRAWRLPALVASHVTSPLHAVAFEAQRAARGEGDQPAVVGAVVHHVDAIGSSGLGEHRSDRGDHEVGASLWTGTTTATRSPDGGSSGRARPR